MSTQSDIIINGAEKNRSQSVQVVVYAYNQVAYIEKALDSVLCQETTFPFKIMIHDDASTDGTREVIERYRDAFPERINCILQNENQYQQGRRIVTLVWPKLSAEYIALLDGDDMWTDKNKLQAQYDYLNSNPGCALCHTIIDHYDQRQEKTVKRYPPLDRRGERYHLSALASGNFVSTSAVMIRRSALPKLPDDFSSIGYGDYALFSLVARAGWIGLIKKPMALYRIHGSNQWWSRMRADRFKKTRQVEAYILSRLSQGQRRQWTLARDYSVSGILRKFQWGYRRSAQFLARSLFSQGT